MIQAHDDHTEAYLLNNTSNHNIKNLLVIGSLILGKNGHNDLNQGQISARYDLNADSFLIKQALCGFDEAKLEHMIDVPLSEQAKAPRLAPPELPLHQAIYQKRPDVKAIVHTHAHNAVLFSAFDWQIEPISHEGACFVDELNKFTETSHTILEIDTARRVANALGNVKALLLQNHGMVVVGKSIQEAVVLAVLLEKACQIQLQAKAYGMHYEIANQRDIKLKKDFIFSRSSINSFWHNLSNDFIKEK